jgi:hypothetical protein
VAPANPTYHGEDIVRRTVATGLKERMAQREDLCKGQLSLLVPMTGKKFSILACKNLPTAIFPFRRHDDLIVVARLVAPD